MTATDRSHGAQLWLQDSPPGICRAEDNLASLLVAQSSSHTQPPGRRTALREASFVPEPQVNTQHNQEAGAGEQLLGGKLGLALRTPVTYVRGLGLPSQSCSQHHLLANADPGEAVVGPPVSEGDLDGVPKANIWSMNKWLAVFSL